MVFPIRTVILAAIPLASSVSAHGIILTPKPRLAGDASKAACGLQMYNGQAGDKMGNIQQELQQTTQKDFNPDACNIYLCKGYLLADNIANVQQYTAGQVVPITYEIEAPHTGTANVSIIKTETNTIIDTLASYPSFAKTNGDGTNQTSFSVTIPSDLGSTCSTAGDCVIQHFWDSPSVEQTYESCIDFTV